MTNPTTADPHELTVERQLHPDDSETYVVTLGSKHAAVIALVAARAGLDPADWLLRVVGERLADKAATDSTAAPPDALEFLH